MKYRLLGPLEVAEDGRSVSLGGSRARALLALLLLHRNELVAVDRIVDELWSDEPPKSAGQIVRVYVSNLRKALEPGRPDGSPRILITQGSGYILKVDPDEVDVDRFDALRAEGRRLLTAGDSADAVDTLDEALALWRGPPLQDFAYEAFAQDEIARLDELRVATLEDRFDAQLAAGRSAELVADLEQLVQANPLRERLRAQLMLALYRSGRPAEALETYRYGRRLLVDELGLEPGENLRRLEMQILQQDPELDRPNASPYPAEALGRPPPRLRWRALAAIAVTLLGVAAIGILIAATTRHGQRLPIATSTRVALVLGVPRNLRDTSPTEVAPINGLHAATEDTGVRTKVLYGGYTLSSFLRRIAAAARTSDFVIIGPTQNLEAVSRLTRRFPQTRFLVPDSVFDKGAAFAGQRNVTGIKFDDRENGYLAGYLAGRMTHGDQAVSAVGGIPTEAVRDLIAGFIAGAHHARPHIRVLVDYTRTSVSPAACEFAANRQITRDSHVIFDAASTCGFGALRAAGIRDVWGLGVASDDSDLRYLGPQMLGSVVTHTDRAIQLAVTLFASGQLPGGQDLRLDLASGDIGLLVTSERVPAAVRAKVESVAAKLSARDEARNSG